MMILNRIQKLLFTEYSDFEDYVILECPFAQTTRDGQGIQQLQIGITPTKLILAKYFLEKRCPTTKEDPIIGNLELLSILPVESVALSVYHRKTRKTIKATFANHQILYFELAISSRREMFWNLWVERMHNLHPESNSPPWTEDSDCSSESIQISATKAAFKAKWEERDLFLGNTFGSVSKKFLLGKPLRSTQPSTEVKLTNTHLPPPPLPNAHLVQTNQRINRFGENVEENCVTSLYLPRTSLVESQTLNVETKSPLLHDGTALPSTPCRTVCMAEIVDGLWTMNLDQNADENRSSLITPHSFYYSGFGVTDMDRGSILSLQMRKWASEVKLFSLQEQTEFLDSTTAISPKHTLVSSMSSEWDKKLGKNLQHIDRLRGKKQRNNTIKRELCWDSEDTDYERPVAEWYRMLQQHLTKLKITDQAAGDNLSRSSDNIDISVSSWDFDSTVLSCQLTLTDRDMFLKIRPSEIRTLLNDKTSKNAPRVRQLINFSERIAELVATEIVRVGSLKMRARLIVRYVNIADKLHHLQNMNSVHSILNGLTMPAIHRMTNTWQYVYKHHNSKYKKLEILVEMYKDIRTPPYSEMVRKFSQNPPFLPSVMYLIYGLLGHLPTSADVKSFLNCKSIMSQQSHQRFLSNLKSEDGSIISQPRNSSKKISNHSLPWNGKIAGTGALEIAQEMLKIWQKAAAAYDLIDSALVKEFLMKSESLSAEDIFFFSKKTEPNG